MENLEKIFNFLHKVEKLKSTLRYNQTSEGRKESSAEHSWRLSLMVFVVARELKMKLDIDKAIRIAIAHDLAEALTGDIDAVKIAEGRATKADKEKLELDAMEKLKETLPEEIGREIYGLWNEYEAGETTEARFVKALDKIETLTQLYEAGYKFYDKPEFIANYADKAVKNIPELTDILKIVKRKIKEEFAKGNIPWYKKYEEII